MILKSQLSNWANIYVHPSRKVILTYKKFIKNILIKKNTSNQVKNLIKKIKIIQLGWSYYFSLVIKQIYLTHLLHWYTLKKWKTFLMKKYQRF